MPEFAHGPVLLCFDGSDDARDAIAVAGARLSNRAAVLLTVVESLPAWEPYDPATVLTAPLSRLAAQALDLETFAQDMARQVMERGLTLAGAAGFTAEGRTVDGRKPWRVICEVADDVDAETIVLGARGRGQAEALLLGSVSFRVAVHTRRAILIVPSAGPPHHRPEQPPASG